VHLDDEAHRDVLVHLVLQARQRRHERDAVVRARRSAERAHLARAAACDRGARDAVVGRASDHSIVRTAWLRKTSSPRRSASSSGTCCRPPTTRLSRMKSASTRFE
jgi:hypothetical protein